LTVSSPNFFNNILTAPTRDEGHHEPQFGTTLETSGKDVENTLETSGKDHKTTLETGGEDMKNTLETSGKDANPAAKAT
jgi:hypothetical protein